MSVYADLSSANKKIVASATIFCFIGQRSVALYSANRLRGIPVIGSRTAFRCIILRERAARHSRYRFAGNVPLHHAPRTSRAAFPLSVRGQRSVASCSASNVPLHHTPRTGRTAFPLSVRGQRFVASFPAGNVPLHHTPRTGRAAFPLLVRGQRFVASCSASNVPLHYTPRTGRAAFPLSVRGQRFAASYPVGNVPLHHAPRTGTITFPLSVRGQRFVASCSSFRRLAGGARRTRHSSTVNVDPLPGVLSTEMLPPHSLHMRWQMARPSPLPAPGFA